MLDNFDEFSVGSTHSDPESNCKDPVVNRSLNSAKLINKI